MLFYALTGALRNGEEGELLGWAMVLADGIDRAPRMVVLGNCGCDGGE